MPGALVSAKIEKVLSDGLSLSFLTFFSGTADQFHLAQVWLPFFTPHDLSCMLAELVMLCMQHKLSWQCHSQPHVCDACV